MLLESFQHVPKMYTWALSENQASIQFRCRLVGESKRNGTDGIFPHWFRSDDNNFGDDDDDGADFTVHEEQESDQYTAIGKKGL
jgi:hypothetical protein